MSSKIFIAGLCQETHDFSPIPTNRAAFGMIEWLPVEHDAVPPPNLDLLGYGGFLRRAREAGADLRLGPFLAAQPAAPMSQQTWEGIKKEILDRLEAAGEVDSVFLFLHGACSAQGIYDCEGDLLEEVRAFVGEDTPIAIEVDLHGNLTRRMSACSNVIVAVQEYPHVDFGDRGGHAYDLLAGMLRGEVSPQMAIRKVPFCGFYPTAFEPMRSFVEEIRELEKQSDILSVSALHGFTGSDNPETGGAVIVIADGDRALAERTADHVARRLFDVARAAEDLGLPVEQALDQVAGETAYPIVLADRTDNAGGGAASDSTWILHAVIERGLRDVVIGGVWDPVAAQLAHLAGVGAVLPLRIGGKTGPLSGTPVDVTVEVIALRDDVHQAFFGRGEPTLPAGRSALVRADGVEIVLVSERQQVFDTRLFTGHGVDLSAKRLIVVKSTQHFYESFAPLAGKVIYCDPPGTNTPDMSVFPFRHLKRPIYPLDLDTPFQTETLA